MRTTTLASLALLGAVTSCTKAPPPTTAHATADLASTLSLAVPALHERLEVRAQPWSPDAAGARPSVAETFGVTLPQTGLDALEVRSGAATVSLRRS